MFLLLCSGLCLFLSLGFGFGVFFVALPLLFLKFPVIVMAILEFILSFSHYYWDIFVFVLRLLIEVGGTALHLLVNALPIIIHGWTELCHSLVDIYTYLRYHVFPSFADFFSQQRDVFLLFWGFIVTSVYTLYNLFTTAANGDQRYRGGRNNNNHGNRNRNRHNDFWGGLHNDDIDDDRNANRFLDGYDGGRQEELNERRGAFMDDYDGDNNLDDIRNGTRFMDGFNAADGPRRRHGDQTDRHDIRMRGDLDRHGVQTDRQDNRMRGDHNRHGVQIDRRDERVFEEEQCVVCFERDRNAAMFPCGHTQTCLTCTRNIMGLNRKCPICQRRIAEYRQVFL